MAEVVQASRSTTSPKVVMCYDSDAQDAFTVEEGAENLNEEISSDRADVGPGEPNHHRCSEHHPSVASTSCHRQPWRYPGESTLRWLKLSPYLKLIASTEAKPAAATTTSVMLLTLAPSIEYVTAESPQATMLYRAVGAAHGLGGSV